MGCKKLTYSQGENRTPFLGIWKRGAKEKPPLFFCDALEKNPATPNFCNDYTPFGLTFNHWGQSPENLYKFGNKEEQKEWEMLDFGQRMYDPAIARFNRVDRFADKYAAFSPYSYAANNPILFVDVNGDSIDVSGILANKDMAQVFKAFFNTKTGKAFIGQFAAKGQTVLGHTFDSDGEYHSAGVDLSYNAESLGTENSPNGQTDVNISGEGTDSERLKIGITLNTDLNTEGAYGGGAAVENYQSALTNYQNGTGSKDAAIQAKRGYLADRGGTLVHESFIHGQHFTNNYMNGARSRADLNRAGGYKNHHYFEYNNRGNTKFSTSGIRVILSIHNQFRTGKSAAEINRDAHDFSLR